MKQNKKKENLNIPEHEANHCQWLHVSSMSKVSAGLSMFCVHFTPVCNPYTLISREPSSLTLILLPTISLGKTRSSRIAS